MRTGFGTTVLVGLTPLLIAASAVAVPPTPAPPPSVGPDVVMTGIGTGGIGNNFGDVNNTGVSTNGVVGAITAFSVQTVSCNIGNAPVPWFADTNQHPVFGVQIYRLRIVDGAGRFEQIGMNWLKHGFCGDDFARCTDLVDPPQLPVTQPDCDGLGPYRTDIYGAALNGSQANLGPRSEVNPWTGGFAFPFVLGFGQTGDAVFKRVQTPSAALLTGEQYFLEAVVVSPDEPAANRMNNYSHRAAAWSGSVLTLSGPTFAMQPALAAWSSLDPAVQVSTAEPLGGVDGRVMLGSRATQIAPGAWRYEYALLNMNLDAAIGSFGVPVATGVLVSAQGFTDVAYHSGDVFDGTDWATVRTPGAVEWSTATFAENPNANALRWGTLYNFRFDCAHPPVPGSVTVGLFKSGGAALLAAQVPSTPPCSGDLNGDNATNTADLVLLLVSFGQPVDAGCCGDLNGDSVVNTADLVLLLAAFGCAGS